MTGKRFRVRSSVLKTSSASGTQRDCQSLLKLHRCSVMSLFCCSHKSIINISPCYIVSRNSVFSIQTTLVQHLKACVNTRCVYISFDATSLWSKIAPAKLTVMYLSYHEGPPSSWRLRGVTCMNVLTSLH